MQIHLPKMIEVKNRSKVKVGKYFNVEFIRVTHSIADSYAVLVTCLLYTSLMNVRKSTV